MFDGDTAFTLYDTYGFPLDLTQDALQARGISVDKASFTDAMERQSAKARASWSGSGDTASENIWFPLREKLGATEFLGYETESAEGVVDGAGEGRQGCRQPQGRRDRRDRAEPDAVLCGVRRPGRRHRRADRRGRQVPRHRHPEEGRRSVRASRHGGAGHAEGRHRRCSSKSITRGARRSAPITPRRICCTRRCGRCSAITSPSAARWWRRIACASTSCIRSRSRPEELARVEDIANEVVLENDEVTTRLMAVDDAREAGARALFGEKYGDEVRVVSMGKQAARAGQQRARLVGRTVRRHPCAPHRRYRPDLGDRRKRGRLRRAPHRGADRASCAQARQRHHGAGEDRGGELRTTVDDMPARIAALMEERKKLERDLSDARKKLAMGGGASTAARRRPAACARSAASS